MTRPEIEVVRITHRGVSISQAAMDLLLEAGMIAAHGRKPVPGTPTWWVTTARFLTQFGLRSLRDLPGAYLTAPSPLGAMPAGGGRLSPRGSTSSRTRRFWARICPSRIPGRPDGRFRLSRA